MPIFPSAQLADYTGGSWSQPPLGSIGGFCFDARRIQPGECFVALSGGARDGHDFIGQAAKGGAVAAMVETLQPVALPQLQVANSLSALGAIAAAVRSQFHQPLVGITGSCGKTSTKEMLRLLLGEQGTHATAGNWNNQIGVPMTLLGLNPRQQDFAVIEAGINQPGEMKLLGQMIQADLTVLTHIGAAHLAGLDNLETIATEKAQLTQQAKADAPILLPAEALRYPAYAQLAPRAIVLLSATDPAPEMPTLATHCFELTTPKDQAEEAARAKPGESLAPYQSQQITIDGSASYQIASLSRGNASNAALAILAARRLGIAEADIRARIEAWRPSRDRGRIETCGQQTFYIDCYNANPASMADALAAFTAGTSQAAARYYILGGMNELGKKAAEQHEAMGYLLQLRPQDRAAFVGPTKLTQVYAAGARAAGADKAQLQCVEKAAALQATVANFSGAIFLKGSRSYQLEQLLPPTRLNS